MNNMKKLIALIKESELNNTYNFVGTCVDSFDEDTMEYYYSKINDINDFAIIDEEYLVPENNNPKLLKNIKGYIPTLENESIVSYIPDNDMIIIYNPDEDIHYFYE